MSHTVCRGNDLQCVHTTFRHVSGIYVCKVCRAKWEISMDGARVTRLTKNNVDQLTKKKGPTE